MPQIQTKFFGELDYSLESAFRFPAGLPGFQAETAFVFLERPDANPLMFMQSVSNPSLCFILLPVLIADPEYQLRLNEEDRCALSLPSFGEPRLGEDILCGALVCAGINSSEATVNLLAPIVVNLNLRTGMQIIQTQSGYSHRHPLPARKPEEALALCS